MDKLDIIIDHLERLENEVNDIKGGLQVINGNQTVFKNGLTDNFNKVLGNQMTILSEIKKLNK